MMEETVQVVVQRLPTWYLMFIVPLLLYFVATHAKRDKQGKWYWYSATYEREKQLRKMDKVLVELQTNEKSQSLVVNKINETLNQNQVDKERLGGAFVEMMKKVDALAANFKAAEDVLHQSIRANATAHEGAAAHFKTLDSEMIILTDRCQIRELEVLKQSVWLQDMPIEERIYAGVRYVHLGGNSKTKEQLVRLCKENIGIWTAVKIACKDMEETIKLIDVEVQK